MRERGGAQAACAVIPARKNARPWLETTPGARARNEILRATRRLGRTIRRRWSGYHRQSQVETRMRCLKLLGERVMGRDFDRQVAELQIRAFAGSLGPVAFTRSLHEPLHRPWNAANSARGMTLSKGRENSASG